MTVNITTTAARLRTSFSERAAERRAHRRLVDGGIEREAAEHAARVQQPDICISHDGARHRDALVVCSQGGIRQCGIVGAANRANRTPGTVHPDKLAALAAAGAMREHAGRRHGKRGAFDRGLRSRE